MCGRLGPLHITDELLDLIEVSLFGKPIFPVSKVFFNLGEIQMAELDTLVKVARTVPASKTTRFLISNNSRNSFVFVHRKSF